MTAETQAALERVRLLHADRHWCTGNAWYDPNDSSRWPCPTTSALGAPLKVGDPSPEVR